MAWIFLKTSQSENTQVSKGKRLNKRWIIFVSESPIVSCFASHDVQCCLPDDAQYLNIAMPSERCAPDLRSSKSSTSSSEDGSMAFSQQEEDEKNLPFDLRSLDLQDLLTATTATVEIAVSVVATDDDDETNDRSTADVKSEGTTCS
jgi:hypothetical protein